MKISNAAMNWYREGIILVNHFLSEVWLALLDCSLQTQLMLKKIAPTREIVADR